MGEVYRATDTKLHRDVALKFLPEQFTSDHDRMERFQREAHVLASLNHTHIATIYGLEESQGTRALAMELVVGPTLADRVAQGSMSIDETLAIAKQIAEALEYAHEHGIIHRDLKPANIKLTQEGQVKVLDFGLAKAMSDDARASLLSNSPTLSLAATQAGVILGTAAYMSPEQAKGKTVDRRADIWSFGVVVFEMLTGRTMYSGETVSETMAQVMMKEPEWDALPATTPRRLRTLLRRCLVKDPRNRMRDIGDVRIALEEVIAQPEEQATLQPAAGPQTPRWTRWAPWGIAAVTALIAGFALWTTRNAPTSTQPPMRLTANLGVDGTLLTGVGAAAFLSPDGKLLAFVASKAAGQPAQLYLRRLDQLQASPVGGTLGARNAFFSPDGQWIAFFAEGKLKKVSISGGAAVTLSDAEDDRGGTWADDGSIVFTPTTRAGLFRVSSGGGKAEPLTKLDPAASEITHRWPRAVRGSNGVLFIASAISNNYEDATIMARSLKTGEQKIVHRGGYYPQYLSSGHFVYVHQGTLFAALFDPNRLELSSQPVPVLEGVMSTGNNGASQWAASDTGTLVYLAGGNTTGGLSLHWMGRDAKTEPLRATLAGYLYPRFSPDGKRIAFEIIDQQYDIWVYEWLRDTITRLTFDQTQDARPVWTPDGRRIAFASQRADKATFNLYWLKADGGDAQRLTESKNTQFPNSWHPTGKFLAFSENQPKTATDIMVLPIDGSDAAGWKPGTAQAFLATQFTERDPIFSPDGQWLAYTSNESGQSKIYVRPFPIRDGKWQISTAGGDHATWSRNGKELFYKTLDQRIMSITYKTEGDSFRADKPQLWSEGQFTDRGTARNYDLHPDGQRFAVLKTPQTQDQTRLDKATLIFNFFDELRRIALASH